MTDIPIFDELGPVTERQWDSMRARLEQSTFDTEFWMIGGSIDIERIAETSRANERARPKLRLIQGGKK